MFPQETSNTARNKYKRFFIGNIFWRNSLSRKRDYDFFNYKFLNR
ncbi:hypothetical protein NMS_0985 [Nonlabens marinus S1-08]|uniref:Uncharacterized protein n=1 Tax=Nonlabens marinus S1-08 TaxID=1454201 RepID=W8VPD5_9FLAO|nr:hypothetical protein NMS_0985 [Nonlabens marinus S1-08]